MFKIGEFSKLTQVSVRMLRYYDETGLLKPVEIDKFTNYRLYSADQMNKLNRIKFLRDLGFHVSEIAIALNQWDDSFIIQLLDNKRIEIENNLKLEQDKLTKIEMGKRDVRQQKIMIHCNVSIKSIPSYSVFSLRRVVPDYYSEGLLWKEMSAFAEKHNMVITDNTFSIYHDPEYKESNVDIEICARTDKMGKDTEGFTFRNTEAVPIMACTMVHGTFKNIAGAYIEFANWLQEHSQYSMGDHSRQMVHRGSWNEENPDGYLTEIQIPLTDII